MREKNVPCMKMKKHPGIVWLKKLLAKCYANESVLQAVTRAGKAFLMYLWLLLSFYDWLSIKFFS